VHQVNPESESFARDREVCIPPTRDRYLGQDHAESGRREIQNEIIPFHNPRNQGRNQAIAQHSSLILDLQQIQPASINELAETIGQSTSATRNHLRRLMQLGLVIKTSFEHHSLYCLNGCYNVHIARILSEFYE
jgi:biotin operon repressor